MSGLDSFDRKISGYVHNCKSKILEVLLLPFAWIFNSIGIMIPLSLMYFIASNFSFGSKFAYGLKYLGIYMLCILFTLVLTTVTKRVFKRQRPKVHGVPRLCNLRKNETNKSMPSGDTAQATLFAFYILFVLNLTAWPLLIIPLVAIGRVFYHCHWIGDTFGGFFAGILGAMFGVGVDFILSMI